MRRFKSAEYRYAPPRREAGGVGRAGAHAAHVAAKRRDEDVRAVAQPQRDRRVVPLALRVRLVPAGGRRAPNAADRRHAKPRGDAMPLDRARALLLSSLSMKRSLSLDETLARNARARQTRCPARRRQKPRSSGLSPNNRARESSEARARNKRRTRASRSSVAGRARLSGARRAAAFARRCVSKRRGCRRKNARRSPERAKSKSRGARQYTRSEVARSHERKGARA